MEQAKVLGIPADVIVEFSKITPHSTLASYHQSVDLGKVQLDSLLSNWLSQKD